MLSCVGSARQIIVEEIVMKYLLAVLLLASTGLAAETINGWVSDAECATGRAKDGIFTGTNPDCAKRCVGEGKKIVSACGCARISARPRSSAAVTGMRPKSLMSLPHPMAPSTSQP